MGAMHQLTVEIDEVIRIGDDLRVRVLAVNGVRTRLAVTRDERAATADGTAETRPTLDGEESG